MFDQTLCHLADNRLITLSGEPEDIDKKGGVKVDIAHDGLITGWPTLQQWLTERRGAELNRRRLEARAEEWVRLGRGVGGLLDAAQLPEAERWLSSPAAEEALGYSETLLAWVQTSKGCLRSAAARQYRWHVQVPAAAPLGRRMPMEAIFQTATSCIPCHRVGHSQAGAVCGRGSDT